MVVRRLRNRRRWPYLHIKKVNGVYVCTAKLCNVVGEGSTMRGAYVNWHERYDFIL